MHSYFIYGYFTLVSILDQWHTRMWKDSCMFAQYNKVLHQTMFGFGHVTVAADNV